MNAQSLARQLAALGEGRDKVLVHVNPEEALELALKKGGTINPHTGLPQFGLFGALGGLIGDVFGGSKSAGSQASTSLTNLAQPLTNVGNSLIKQYNSGQLNAGDQSNLASSLKSQDSALDQLYSSMGLKDSSQLANQKSQVATQGVQAHQQILNSYLQSGLSAYGEAFKPLEDAIKYQFDQNQQTSSDLGGIIGSIFGGGGSGGSSGGSLLGSAGSAIGGLFGSGGALGSGSAIWDVAESALAFI